MNEMRRSIDVASAQAQTFERKRNNTEDSPIWRWTIWSALRVMEYMKRRSLELGSVKVMAVSGTSIQDPSALMRAGVMAYVWEM